MARWLALKDAFGPPDAFTLRRFDAGPCPTVQAFGVAGVAKNQYFVVEAENEAMARWLVYRDAKTGRHLPGGGFIEEQHIRQRFDAGPAPAVMAAGMGGVARHQALVEDDGGPDVQPDPNKPPYRVPSMAEVRALPWNGYKMVSTFSGCGGSCLGFKMAGFKVVWASEFIDAARETYLANHEGTIVDGRDIRDVKAEDILAATGLARGELDVFEGSPPCASFSTAGKRQKHWGEVKSYSDKKQRTDDLFFEYIRLIDGLRPKVFVAENVSGLVKGSAKGYFKMILRAMKELGYTVEVGLLDAQWLGVPQTRQRVIFMGTRNDLAIKPAWPTPFPYRYSIADALPWVKAVAHTGGGIEEDRVFDVAREPMNTVRAPGGGHQTQYEVEAEADISRFAIGAEWDKLAPGEQSEKYFNLVKPHQDEPSPAITATGGCSSAAAVTHPTEKRKFTIAELRRICAFPDDFILTGSYAQQWERLGRSVPPLMMKAVADVVRDKVFGKT